MSDKSQNINYNISDKYSGSRISRKEVFQILQDIKKDGVNLRHPFCVHILCS